MKAEIGQHLLDVAHDNNIELEGMQEMRHCALLLLLRFMGVTHTRAWIIVFVPRSMRGRTGMFHVPSHLRSRCL